jgi:hypothetical protein
MALTNLHRLVSEVANGKREHIIVHPVSVVKDTETYGVENDPFKLFWECCIRPEPDNVLKLHEIWANYRSFTNTYYKNDDVFSGAKEAQLAPWLKQHVGGPEKKSRGRHQGVTGYWNIRLATATEEEEHRLALTSVYPLEALLHEESVKRKGTDEGTSSSRRVRGLNNDVPSSMASTMFVGSYLPDPPPPSESECYEDWNKDDDDDMSF